MQELFFLGVFSGCESATGAGDVGEASSKNTELAHEVPASAPASNDPAADLAKVVALYQAYSAFVGMDGSEGSAVWNEENEVCEQNANTETCTTQVGDEYFNSVVDAYYSDKITPMPAEMMDTASNYYMETKMAFGTSTLEVGGSYDVLNLTSSNSTGDYLFDLNMESESSSYLKSLEDGTLIETVSGTMKHLEGKVTFDYSYRFMGEYTARASYTMDLEELLDTTELGAADLKLSSSDILNSAGVKVGTMEQWRLSQRYYDASGNLIGTVESAL